MTMQHVGPFETDVDHYLSRLLPSLGLPEAVQKKFMEPEGMRKCLVGAVAASLALCEDELGLGQIIQTFDADHRHAPILREVEHQAAPDTIAEMGSFWAALYDSHGSNDARERMLEVLAARSSLIKYAAQKSPDEARALGEDPSFLWLSRLAMLLIRKTVVVK